MCQKCVNVSENMETIAWGNVGRSEGYEWIRIPRTPTGALLRMGVKHVWLSLGGVRRNADEDALLTSGVTLLFDIGAQLHKV